MIKIIIPESDVNVAIDMRDRIKESILVIGETVHISDGGVVITTSDPTRVCMELEADGFDFGNSC